LLSLRKGAGATSGGRLVLTSRILGSLRSLGGAQRARGHGESAVRRFRQDPHVPADQVLADYDRWLQRQALAARTRSSYRRWVRELLELLDAAGDLEVFLGRDGEHDRRAILGDWRRRLLDRGLAPTTVNLALAAATSLLDSLALPTPRVPRVEVDPAPARALTPDELRAVEYQTDRLASTRDRAIMELLLQTGVRIGELADLDAGDVRLTQRTGELVIRHGKGERRRVVPLNRSARAALRPWLTDRLEHPSAPARDRGPLWISRTGEQLSVRSITKLVTKVMAAADVHETAHGLRHTLATQLVRDHGRDLALVADVLGHADVKTTRRYARSQLEDRRAALEALDR
jgi:site-specific recombinase XerD